MEIDRSKLAPLLTALVGGTLGVSGLAQNSAPNPYETVAGWAKIPAGRAWGATSAVYPAPDGRNIWVAERCGANLCAGSELDPIMLFDPQGRVIRSFGAGLIAWPHGIFVEPNGNLWVTDAVGYAAVPAGWGHVVLKFSPDGDLLMTLGTKGVAGEGRNTFTKPSDVLVAPNGDIFVADGHDADGNNRIVKFSSDGTYLKEWGSAGSENGQFRDPHALAMDSRGRLFVGDRGNSRIQIFDQEGNHLSTWTQFGRPSGLFIDRNDTLYCADSESNASRNPGWRRGIRIGSASDGFVFAFIPDPEPDQNGSATSAAEGVAVDAAGNIYGAEVGPREVKKYIRPE
ncbi:MAG: peptidyl-alpha-hydroxyglycine alpha-amidating lyase family protein [Woeseia sp.]